MSHGYQALELQKASPSPKNDSPVVNMDDGMCLLLPFETAPNNDSSTGTDGGFTMQIYDMSVCQKLRRPLCFLALFVSLALCAVILYLSIPHMQEPHQNGNNSIVTDQNVNLLNALTPSEPTHIDIGHEFVSYLSRQTVQNPIADDCVFTLHNQEQRQYEESAESILDKLLIDSNDYWADYEIKTLNNENYKVSYIYGTSRDKMQTEKNRDKSFVVVLKASDTSSQASHVNEVYLLSSDYSQDTPEDLFGMIFDAFDFNKNGLLCVTEFGAMMSAITGWRREDKSNETGVLSYIPDTDDMRHHIKFTKSEFVQILSNDEVCQRIKNFGELRNVAKVGAMDGYVAMQHSDKVCAYYDFAWNCVETSAFYATDRSEKALFTVSRTVFSNICCSA